MPWIDHTAFSAAHAGERAAPILAFVDLSGQWRANVADDERRRSAVGLDYRDDDWPEVKARLSSRLEQFG